MAEQGNSKGIAGAVIAAGALIVIGFFLPVISACGIQFNGPEVAGEEPEYWLYLAVGVAVAVCGLMGFGAVGALRLAAIVAIATLGHMIFRTIQASQNDAIGILTPLVGYYVTLLGLLVTAVAPWFAKAAPDEEWAGDGDDDFG